MWAVLSKILMVLQAKKALDDLRGAGNKPASPFMPWLQPGVIQPMNLNPGSSGDGGSGDMLRILGNLRAGKSWSEGTNIGSILSLFK
jgi:hypothetical protein